MNTWIEAVPVRATATVYAVSAAARPVLCASDVEFELHRAAAAWAALAAEIGRERRDPELELTAALAGVRSPAGPARSVRSPSSFARLSAFGWCTMALEKLANGDTRGAAACYDRAVDAGCDLPTVGIELRALFAEIDGALRAR